MAAEFYDSRVLVKSSGAVGNLWKDKVPFVIFYGDYGYDYESSFFHFWRYVLTAATTVL